MTDMRGKTLPWLVPDTGTIAPAAQTLLDFMRSLAAAPTAIEGGPSHGNLSGRPEPVQRVEELEVAGGAGPVPGRLYRPAGCEGGPLLLWFHGGGFVGGGLNSHDVPLRALANRAGCAILSVAYRLAPAHPFPAAVEDAAASIGWAAANAGSLGLDAARIMVGGDSAGGSIATAGIMLAGQPVALQILVYPDTDARAGINHPSWSMFDGIVLDRAGKEIVLDQYLPPGIDRTQPHASPVLAPPDLLRILPPTLVVTAEFDPQRDEGERYADQLRGAGVRVALTRIPGMIHGFLQMAGVLKQGRQLLDEMAAAIRSI